MSLERKLQINMACLAGLASLMLGRGEGNSLLPLMAAVVAATSVYFTDIKGWISLNTTLANIAGLIAFVISLWDYRSLGHENQLLALANLLIYLQCVLLYRRKNARIYWMLALLSLLQVAVATVLELELWFGILLLVYLFLALNTLSIFLIHREQQAHDEAIHAQTELRQTAHSGARWPLIGQFSQFLPRESSHVQPMAPRGRLPRQVFEMGLYCLAISSILFMLVPRTGQGNWGDSFESQHRTVGFSDEVELGELGEVVENPDVVMRIRWETMDGKAYHLAETPLIRGSVLMRYAQGRWSKNTTLTAVHGLDPQPRQDAGLVRQFVELNPLDTPTLFSIYPAFKPDSLTDPSASGQITPGYDPYQHHLTRSQNPAHGTLRYELVTTGLQNGLQLRYTPAQYYPSYEHRRRLLAMPVAVTEKDRLQGLRDLAAEIVKDIPPQDVLARANALNRYLSESGHFRYTMVAVQRNPNLDPIEDFLLEHRQGHCEYFASALALMLRSVEIPARVIVGFKGAEWNPMTKWYNVQQLHAHAWVEVYLQADQLPKELTRRDERYRVTTSRFFWQNGGWMRLDPTPGVSGIEMPTETGTIPTFWHLFDYVDTLWSGYVVSMDSRRQRDAVYQPLQATIADIKEVLFDPAGWQRTWQNLKLILQGKRPDEEGLWFDWRAALLTMMVLLMTVALYRLGMFAMRRLFRATGDGTIQAGDRRVPQVEFYRRLEHLLAKQKIVRRASQTQREFAKAAARELSGNSLTVQLAGLPARIVEKFYRVRFGGATLEPAEVQEVDRALRELEHAIAPSSGWSSISLPVVKK